MRSHNTACTSSAGRRPRLRSSRFVALRPGILAALAWLLLATPSHAAVIRNIFEGVHPYGDTGNYMDTFSSAYGYVFGRSEGQPACGPNPINGSTDVDFFYDLVPVIHQYYVDKFNRNGPNGFGGTGVGGSTPLNVYKVFADVKFTGGKPFNSAVFFSSGAVGFSPGFTDLDLVGHEVNHIVSYTMRQNPDGSFVHLSDVGNVPVGGEAGALNEGLADFFGEAFERYVTGSNDWLFTYPGPDNRSLANPTSVLDLTTGLPHPDRYLSPNFYTGTADRHGEHTNSTVFSHGAYLAAEGGAFNGYAISGVGFDKMEQILYRATTQYFHTGESFNDAYFDILHAAGDLYGPDDVNQVSLALQAVEMNLSRVPEPSTLALAGTAVVVLCFCGRRRKRIR